MFGINKKETKKAENEEKINEKNTDILKVGEFADQTTDPLRYYPNSSFVFWLDNQGK